MKKIFLIGVLLGIIFHLTVNKSYGSGNPGQSSRGNAELLAEDFKVFPNPVVNGKFFVESLRHPLLEIRISNIAGKQVYYRKITQPLQRAEVLTGNYPDGIYLLRITTEGGASRTVKLLISTNR